MNPTPTLSRAVPLELPRLVMRRSTVVAAAALLLVLLLGLWRIGSDTDDETRAALALATTLLRIVDGTGRGDDADAFAPLRETQDLRHVTLKLLDAQSRAVLQTPTTDSIGADTPTRTFALKRPDGIAWSLHVAASRASERREALTGLAQLMLLAASGIALMLAVMAWNMRRAFMPLRGLVAAIERMRGSDAEAAGALSARMPIRELEVIAQALRTLHQDLRDEAARRRVLSRQLLTLQEDERQRLARELHDEFGQQLTAMRVDAVWLSQRLAQAPEQARVAGAIAQRCADVQSDIRSLLTRLQPLTPQIDAAATMGAEPASRLRELLEALVGGWASSTTQTCTFELELSWRLADDHKVPWPSNDDAAHLARDLVLAIYRISQEALTNVARHAQATRAVLSLALHVNAQQRPSAIDWEVADDGVGIAQPALALQRGTGLAGLQERVWALGAELEFGAVADQGLRLHARFDLPRPT